MKMIFVSDMINIQSICAFKNTKDNSIVRAVVWRPYFFFFKNKYFLTLNNTCGE
jgi:hypothetical protein